ncbi:DedA family protein [Candidatus Woesearchaeota archaeon]|nr:DedA family protein [Candidatus Woesearchaeota archaeon]
MAFFNNIIDFILHLDKYLSLLIQNFGIGTYLILFLIVFAETGLVVTPFLPGDSLLFAAGTFASIGALNVWWLFFSLSAAAILGDSLNYAIGKYMGPKVFRQKNARFLKKEYLDKTHNFYEKYGSKTIVLARFVPIVRTFAPFVAGIGRMSYLKFAFYNVFGGILWVGLLVFGGYFFGNITIVRQNFSLAIIVIIILSILPMIIEFWKHYRKKHAIKNNY